MLFSSLQFIYTFLPLVCFFYFISPSLKLKNMVLLIASLIFYACGEPRFVFVMCFSILANYVFGLCIHHFQRQSKLFLSVGIAFNVGLLFVYKYLGFVGGLLAQISPLKPISLVLPIGISFFTFQELSYLIDVYKKSISVQKNVFSLALYVAFFPQLIAGPIVRYNTIEKQLSERTHSANDFVQGFLRFLLGLFKKVLLSNQLALIADAAFNHAPHIGGAMAWLGAVCYALQIFYDFSGYSDMAIGLARMFGFHLLENFNYPYISRSISDFWRRWHISLGFWFRDYVYFPLGGAYCTKSRLVLNLFVVWVLTGLWHGANTTFVVWGLFYFVLIAFEKLTHLPKRLNAFGQKLWQSFTLVLVLLGWVLFRSPSVAFAVDYIKLMFDFKHFSSPQALGYVQNFAPILAVALLFCTPVAKVFSQKCENLGLIKMLDVLKVPIYVLLFLWVTAQLSSGSYNPFIYFQF